MRRALTATLVTCGLAPGGGGLRGRRLQGDEHREPRRHVGRRRAGAEDHPLGRLVGPRARRLQEGRRRVRHGASRGDDRPRRRHRRRQDHGRAAQRHAPDAVSSFTSSNVGAYCSSGGWIDLAPLMKQDGIDASIFPAPARYYTQYNGMRCALPILADAYGLYYNKDLLAKAGDQPRRRRRHRADRRREEADRAQRRRLAQGRRASTRSSGSSRERARRVRAAVRRAVAGRATASRRSATDPAWAEMLTWQKELIDFYGYDKLDKLAGRRRRRVLRLERLRDRQDRHEPRRRVAHRVHQARAPRPALRHGAVAGRRRAARAVRRRLHQRQRSSASRRRRKHQDAAWELVKYLTTDDQALAKLANGLRNVPVHRVARRSRPT